MYLQEIVAYLLCLRRRMFPETCIKSEDFNTKQNDTEMERGRK